LKVKIALALLLVCASKDAVSQSENRLSYGSGVFAIIDDEVEYEAKVEYQFFKKDGVLTPMLGIMGTTAGSYYFYGGFNREFLVNPAWAITASLAAGAYRRGNGKDLGGILEFRSGLEFAYVFNNDSRLGIAIYHISNSNIFDRNPGSESIVITFTPN